jgi:hypothetical protein
MSLNCADIAVPSLAEKVVMAPEPVKKEKSPWASINDVLIQNKCWLCVNTFPKGRMKKVFQVSDLLTFYHNHMQRLQLLKDAELDSKEENTSEEPAATVEGAANDSIKETPTPAGEFNFISENLKKCYNSYVTLMNEGNGLPDRLFAEFRQNDVEVWMSGLVCGNSPECRQELAYFIESKRHTPVDSAASSAGSGKTEVNSMFSFAIPRGTDCPPGCGCDNPWPFMP